MLGTPESETPPCSSTPRVDEHPPRARGTGMYGGTCNAGSRRASEQASDPQIQQSGRGEPLEAPVGGGNAAALESGRRS